jgi:transcriptional regulator with XRE-family HTH domain
MAAQQNIVGPRIQALRREKGLTQAMLAARCGMLGWDVGENVVTKIETQIRCVVDVELLCLARALDVAPAELLPPKEKAKAIVGSYFAEHERG